MFDPFLTTRFPVSRSTATVESEVDGVELVDQTRILELLRRTSLPSSEILNSAEEVLVMGVALFATQITVWTGILLYQMPT